MCDGETVILYSSYNIVTFIEPYNLVHIMKRLLIFFITGLFLIAAVGIAGCIDSPPEKTLTPDEILESSIFVSYDDLFRDNEKYVGQIVFYKGEIIQITEPPGFIRLATKESSYSGYVGDIIYVEYSREGTYYTERRYLEGDIIYVAGRVRGLKTYKTVLGGQVTLPHMYALMMERAP